MSHTPIDNHTGGIAVLCAGCNLTNEAIVRPRTDDDPHDALSQHLHGDGDAAWRTRALAAEAGVERLRAERDAAWKAGAEAMLRKLSGNTGELRDAVAAAIRADGSDICDGQWETLPEANRLGWRGDAERAIAAVKDYLTAQALPLPDQPKERAA